MKILVINPNSSIEMSETIDRVAKKFASSGTSITTVNPDDGPDFLADPYLAALQVPKVISLVEKNKKTYDAFVIACGGDPGLEPCRVVSKNVLGSAEAAIMTACAVARRFSFLNTMKGSSVLDRLHALGIDRNRCASVRVLGGGTGDAIVKGRHKMIKAFCEVGKKCVDEDGAGALILLCAGLCDLTEYLQERIGVPVISGVISAIKIAEQLPSNILGKKH
jgi:allantoin racemase